jgi:SAM-dependent methyltransferase
MEVIARMDAKAASFDLVAALYDEVRPGYPSALYEAISRFKTFSPHSRILEVGAGQGIATQEIGDRWQAGITALEPGAGFCGMLRDRFRGQPNIRVFQTTFEAFNCDIPYDAVFSATAFHWIEPAVRYRKAFDCLAEDGLLVLYWNNYSIYNDSLAEAIQKIYEKHGMPPVGPKAARLALADKIEKRKSEVEASGFFALLDHRLVERVIAYDAARYVKLLKTFSDHSQETIRDIAGFSGSVEKIIVDAGDRIDVKVTTNLEIAGKKARPQLLEERPGEESV